MIKKNLIANYFGQAWSALMAIAFIPIYIKYLGIEAYGLIGSYALIQTFFSILDMGMTPTMLRECARLDKNSKTSINSIRTLLRSAEIIVSIIAALFFVISLISSEWLADSWLTYKILSLSEVALVFKIIGFLLPLRLLEGLYRSCIIGLQKQVLFNYIIIGTSTLKGFVVIGILAFVSPSLEAYFLWHVFASILTVLLLAYFTYKNIPTIKTKINFSTKSIKKIFSYAKGTTLITITGVALSQIDKVFLSKFLTLSEYGIYTLAAMIASSIYIFIFPVIQTWFPVFAKLHSEERESKLVYEYHKSSQLVSVMSGSVVAILIFFSPLLLNIWTLNKLSGEDITLLIKILLCGNLINGISLIPIQMQLAFQWTSLTIKNNLMVLIIILPLMFIFSKQYGALGAAITWTSFSFISLLFSINFMHKKILLFEKKRWYIEDIFFPIFSAFLTAFFLSNFLLLNLIAPLIILILIVASLLTLFVSLMCSSLLRPILISDMKKILNKKLL